MLQILSCVGTEHDLRLVGLSAAICLLGSCTTTILLARSRDRAGRRSVWPLVCAAAVFGCSTWSLHFVAMLAFMPGLTVAYDLGETGVSILVASVGALAALLAWTSTGPAPTRAVIGGTLLGLAISGMHYLGVAAMRFSGFLLFHRTLVVASILVSVVFFIVALTRAFDLRTPVRRAEVTLWLTLAVLGLHFTGMTGLTVVPGAATAAGTAVLGTTLLAAVVGVVSLTILLASLMVIAVEWSFSQRALADLGRMRLLSNLAQEALFISRDGIVLEVNSAGERLFKTTAAALVGHPLIRLFAEESAATVLRRQQRLLDERHTEEMDLEAADGTPLAVEMSWQPIDYLGRPAVALAIRDLTDRKRDEARIRHLARHDALTNLPNRYSLNERLARALDAAAQHDGRLAVIYLDLDRFKPVNDLHGHACGDALLVQVSRRILAELRPTDTLARIGGDEFVLLLTSDNQREKVSHLATHVIEALRQPFRIEGRRIDIGASAGIAFYPEDGGDAESLMRAADTAMYRVKEEGGTAARFYEASMDVQLQARLQLEHELAGAAERGELVLHYQPIVSGITGEVETFEALIRWNHPGRGFIPPLDFIPLAEETGLINPIGEWVIKTACREAAGWSKPYRVSVNVSPVQFRQSDICQIIEAALRENDIPAKRVVVEVTESILIDDAAKAVATLNRLRNLGVRLALDDFGTGFSSLSYLQLFKFDKFKIDKSFVKKLGQSDDAMTITRTIVNLGHNLGLYVTAEGVETPTQLAILRALGCDQMQGYLIARPGPFQAFTAADHMRVRAAFTQGPLRLSA